MTELFLAVLDRSVIGCYVILVILLIRIPVSYTHLDVYKRQASARM